MFMLMLVMFMLVSICTSDLVQVFIIYMSAGFTCATAKYIASYFD